MNAGTLLLRHAHPKFMTGSEITSQVFMPFPKDRNRLSVYNGDLISASDAFSHFTQKLGYASHSVWAVSKEEADQNDVPPLPDPLPDFQSHTVLKFDKHSDTHLRKIAKKLKIHAQKRGVIFTLEHTA